MQVVSVVELRHGHILGHDRRKLECKRNHELKVPLIGRDLRERVHERHAKKDENRADRGCETDFRVHAGVDVFVRYCFGIKSMLIGVFTNETTPVRMAGAGLGMAQEA